MFLEGTTFAEGKQTLTRTKHDRHLIHRALCHKNASILTFCVTCRETFIALNRFAVFDTNLPVQSRLLAQELPDARDRLVRSLFRLETVDDDAVDGGPQRRGVTLTELALRVGQPPVAVDVRVDHDLHH